MNKRANENENGVFVTVEMASQITNLGKNTVRRRAQECHAMRKIGRTMRINRQVLIDYLDTFEV